MNNELLKIENLSLKIGKTNILQNISFDINPGEVYAFIGPNGCGKSSMAYTIMGLKNYIPDRGKVYFKGDDITNMPVDERARKGITLAWQEPARFEGVSVRKFLSLGLQSRNVEISEEKLEWALNEVAIVPSKYLDRNIDDTLSGGERKRIELASILLMDPEFVILDEPDSGVDVIALNSIANVISDFKINKTGVFLITHSEEMLELVDRAALICNGRIIKKGDPEEISKYFKYECLGCEDDDYTLHPEVNIVE